MTDKDFDRMVTLRTKAMTSHGRFKPEWNLTKAEQAELHELNRRYNDEICPDDGRRTLGQQNWTGD